MFTSKKIPNGNFIILLLYIDEMLIVGQDVKLICRLKDDLAQPFEMKDLRDAYQILSVQIVRDRKAKKLWLSQEQYIEHVLERFHIKGAKTVSTPPASHFKLSKKNCPSTKEEREDVIHSLLLYSWEFDVRDGLHASKYNSCS